MKRTLIILLLACMLVSVSCAEKVATVPITALTDDELLSLYYMSGGYFQSLVDTYPIVLFVVKTLKEDPDFDFSLVYDYESGELTIAEHIKSLLFDYVKNGVPTDIYNQIKESKKSVD